MCHLLPPQAAARRRAERRAAAARAAHHQAVRAPACAAAQVTVTYMRGGVTRRRDPDAPHRRGSLTVSPSLSLLQSSPPLACVRPPEARARRALFRRFTRCSHRRRSLSRSVHRRTDRPTDRLTDRRAHARSRTTPQVRAAAQGGRHRRGGAVRRGGRPAARRGRDRRLRRAVPGEQDQGALDAPRRQLRGIHECVVRSSSLVVVIKGVGRARGGGRAAPRWWWGGGACEGRVRGRAASPTRRTRREDGRAIAPATRTRTSDAWRRWLPGALSTAAAPPPHRPR